MKWSFGFLLLAAACGSSKDSTTTTSSSTATGGAVLYKGSPCEQCDTPACNDEITTCNAEPECAAYVSCEDNCVLGANGDADATCEAACRAPLSAATADKSAQAALGLILTCRQSGPGAMCTECGRDGGGGAGGAGGAEPFCTETTAIPQTCAPSTGDPCNACAHSGCCDPTNEFYSGTGPTGQLAKCWGACGDTDDACRKNCFDMYPEGVQGFGTYEACLLDVCFGNGWCTNPDDTKCAMCERTTCGCEYANCLTDPDCFLANECFADTNCAFGDIQCAKACLVKYPKAKPLLNALQVCMTQLCLPTCSGN